MKNPFSRFFKKPVQNAPPVQNKEDTKPAKVTGIDPGRVSVPEDSAGILGAIRGFTPVVDPSFRVEVIKLLRDLYKINPDVSIALLDTFKLANTGHTVTFPNNTDKEAEAMRNHLNKVTDKWSQYAAGVKGFVNKVMVQ